MDIQVFIKHVYGNETIYPKCEKAKELCRIAGLKTFTPMLISLVKAMDVRILVVSEHASEL